MSAKDCGHHNHKRKRFLRRLFGAFLFFIFIILLIIFIIWLVLRPTKPRFTLQDATVYQFNLSSPNLISSDIQVSISSRNPNDRIGVYYDRLDIFMSYRNQQISLPTMILPAYQGHKDTIIWSPHLVGAAVPVAPYLGAALAQDQSAGIVLVNIKLDGRVRWKVGTWISGKYHLYVNCPAYLTFGSKFAGVNVGSAVRLQVDHPCSVDV